MFEDTKSHGARILLTKTLLLMPWLTWYARSFFLAAEEADNEVMQDIAENQIVGRNLLGAVAPVIIRIVVAESGLSKGAPAPAAAAPNSLFSSAVLALCKFMCVSAEFCSKHLQVRVQIYRCIRR
jgi:hypothetical protein